MLAYSGHVFWTFEISPTTGRCRPRQDASGHVIAFMDKPFNQLRFVTYCLLPFVVILVLNVLIVARLRWTPHSLKPGFAGSNPAVSLAGLEASSVAMATGTEGGGGSGSTARIVNTSASVSAAAMRQRQQARSVRLFSGTTPCQLGRMRILPYEEQPAAVPGGLCCSWVGIRRRATAETRTGGRAHMHTEALAGEACRWTLGRPGVG